MPILSCGDVALSLFLLNELSLDKLPIHSRFSHVINYQVDDETVLSLVDREVAVGPLNIVVENIDETLILRPSKLEKIVFNSSLNSYLNLNSTLACDSLNFQQLFVECAHEKSLAFLLLPKERKKVFKGSFERAMCERFEQANEWIKQIGLGDFHNFQKGINHMRGVGLGLTPAGDDFICGLMVARPDLAPSIAVKKGQNVLVNSFLKMAKQGRVSENLLKILLEERPVSTVNCIGETSGADWMTGFLVGRKLRYEWKDLF